MCESAVFQKAGRPGLLASLPSERRTLFSHAMMIRYIVVKDVLTPAEVAAANAAVDRNYQKAVIAQHRKGLDKVPEGVEVGDTSRWDLRGMLGWAGDDRRPFVNMLAHPKLTRHINTICGKGHRMDHAPTLITQTQGSPAGTLHGSSGPGFNPASYYVWKNGQMVPRCRSWQAAASSSSELLLLLPSDCLILACNGCKCIQPTATRAHCSPDDACVCNYLCVSVCVSVYRGLCTGLGQHNGLIVVSFQLVDCPEGAGGLAVVPGCGIL